MARSLIRTTAQVIALAVLKAMPVSGQAPPQFASLVLGEQNTCGLTPDGVAYCWGDNRFGQVGDGTTRQRTVPTPVAGSLRFRLLSIAGSASEATDRFGRAVKDLKGVHVCGISTDSTAYCWGADGLGQVGAGRSQREPRTTPTKVATDARFATLTTNLGQSCAATALGQAYCWGIPGFRIEEGVSLQFYSTPLAFPADLQIRQFLQDELQICGLTADGNGICWRGGGQRGGVRFREITLPDGKLHSLTPARVRLGTGYCGLDEIGRWLCWDQLESQVGLFTTKPEEEVPGVSFAAITSLGDIRCGLSTTGTLHCSVAGARGDSIATPVLGDTLASLMGSGSGICGLRSDGEGRCIRRLATAAPNESAAAGLRFERVAGDLNWRTLHVARSHSCGITMTDVTYCWGENGSGQLGDGSRRRRTEPVEIRLK